MDMDSFQWVPSVTLSGTACAIFGAYGLELTIYRLRLSPITKFPGPKLAALTKWYEFCYEVVRSGQFIFHIQDLHRKYGMISRSPEDARDAVMLKTTRTNHPHHTRRTTYPRLGIL